MISFKDLGKMGRLGNQLFQISATIALALKNNDSYLYFTFKDFSDNIDIGGDMGNLGF